MCDSFWQRTEADQRGDLADIVRAGGLTTTPSPEFLLTSCGPMPSFRTSSSSTDANRPMNNFGDPFANLGTLCSTNRRARASSMRGNRQAAVQHVLAGASDLSDGSQCVGSVADGDQAFSFNARRHGEVGEGLVGGAADSMAGMQISPPHSSGIKRRKNQAKKVVCIPAPAAANGRPSGEVVPSDLWAWRKYGQKPIKGSPYPRGYYRCSSSKGCSARKQVERSRTDPNMLVITYTSEHNHPWPTQRNALAGSTRSQTTKSSYSGSNSSPRSQKQSQALKEATDSTSSSNINPPAKEEVVENEKPIDAAEYDEFDTISHHGYNPMISESSHSDDFFADLAELEPDPMSLIFSKELSEAKPDEERGDNAMDPFDMFGWARD
uniref:WRKY domain-containing protein n=1 Tax=Ananas comosus var. bracteatus TaxID=296719 RepID=A0A6V7NJ07_ANACO|nr:unnamed protein product [Ananas comosus var. bracteatus]